MVGVSMFEMSLRNKITSLLFCFVLFSCSGGSDSIATSVVSPDPVTEAPESPISCVNEQYPIINVSFEGEVDADFTAAKTIDADTTPESRWSSLGTQQALIFDLGAIKSIGSLKIKWHQGAQRQAYFKIETSIDQSSWQNVLTDSSSSGKHSGFEQVDLTSSNARFIKLTGMGNSDNDWNSIVEVQAHSCEGADGKILDSFPNELGIELLDWYLSVPTDEDNNGTSDSIDENTLAAGYTNSEYFYTSADNGIVMRSPSYGFKTSANTSYVRVELREMLRRGDSSIRTQGVNKNNWVFGSASNLTQANAGGVDGELNVTLAVNNVTTTGENYQIGRLVIGQIHANNDEPVRLYYRKLPNNNNGSIYFAHESRVEDSDEVYVEMIGSRSNSASDPGDGIALDEKFSYRINVTANLLTVTIIREGKDDVEASLDMSDSLFDTQDQYHYFKVGVYHLNNSSDIDEYAQATFYAIRNAHNGYAASE